MICQPAHQFVNQAGWDGIAPVRIDEVEQHEMAQQDGPVAAEPRHQPRPVEIAASVAQQVQHIGPVESLEQLLAGPPEPDDEPEPEPEAAETPPKAPAKKGN